MGVHVQIMVSHHPANSRTEREENEDAASVSRPLSLNEERHLHGRDIQGEGPTFGSNLE